MDAPDLAQIASLEMLANGFEPMRSVDIDQRFIDFESA